MDMKDLQGTMMPSLEQAAEIARLRKEVERLEDLIKKPYLIKHGDNGIVYSLLNTDFHHEFFRSLYEEILDYAEEQGYQFNDINYTDDDLAEACTDRRFYNGEKYQDNPQISSTLDQVNRFIENQVAFSMGSRLSTFIADKVHDHSSDWSDYFVEQNPDTIATLFEGVLQSRQRMFRKVEEGQT